MTIIAIFTISGVAIAVLILSKKYELRFKKSTLVLRLVSKGDERLKELNHRLAEHYLKARDGVERFIKKTVRMRVKLNLNKATGFVKERMDEYSESLRDAKLLKKSDGLSEFFKNIKEVEKGQGEINEVHILEPEVTPVAPTSEITPEPVIKPKRVRKPRKLVVAEEETL